jgi:RNA polymerase sigma factor (TIGR02999 family)
MANQNEISTAKTASADSSAAWPGVYDELRRIAASYLKGERPNHTLQPTALVHEAYLRLVDQNQLDYRNRAQFLGIAAQMMRRILTNHALARQAAKRGGADAVRLTLDDALDFYEARDLNVIAVDDALKELAVLDPRQAQIIEMRFFGGLTMDDVAEALGVSVATVNREWATAKLWLKLHLAPTR